MTLTEYKELADMLGVIANGNLIGFFVMMLAVTGLVMALIHLYKRQLKENAMREQQHAECLKESQMLARQHQQCMIDNRDLALAMIKMGEGNKHEAMTRAQMVYERRDHNNANTGVESE